MIREEIRELDNSELSDAVEALAVLFREEMAAPRTAETLVEAANRLRERK